jgi:5-methylcytosine-specific restriction endonuclease McrA
MAMTKKRAERLTGYEVRPLSGHGDRIRFGAFEGKELITEAAGVVDWLALESLVEQVYRIHSRRVLEENWWRCARCKRVRRLHIHHRRYRSHGGTHRMENLEPVCWDCHRVIHQIERSQ